MSTPGGQNATAEGIKRPGQQRTPPFRIDCSYKLSGGEGAISDLPSKLVSESKVAEILFTVGTNLDEGEPAAY